MLLKKVYRKDIFVWSPTGIQNEGSKGRQKRTVQIHRFFRKPNAVEDFIRRSLSTYDTHALKHLRCYYGDCDYGDCDCGDCDYANCDYGCVTFVLD
jgi:hypothetical protein